MGRLCETWDTLGEWEVAASSRDLRQAIIHATQESKRERVATPFLASWYKALRIAASLALATGLGIAAGAVVSIGGSRPDQAGSLVVNDANVAESLGITELGARSATGLGRGFGVNGSPEGKEASS